MSLPVVFRPEARAEFDAAADWYEQQRPGLGTAFIDQVQKTLDRIAAYPKMHAVEFQDVRKAVVQRFPCCVFYIEEPTQVVVISVFHSSRDPSIWQGRV